MSVVYAVSSLIVTIWTLTAIVMNLPFIKRLVPERACAVVRFLFWELRPLFVPASVFIIGFLALTGDADGSDYFFFGLQLFNWWSLKDPKDDDDDRWKRRREKVAEKVSVLGGRLVVAPVSTS